MKDKRWINGDKLEDHMYHTTLDIDTSTPADFQMKGSPFFKRKLQFSDCALVFPILTSWCSNFPAVSLELVSWSRGRENLGFHKIPQDSRQLADSQKCSMKTFATTQKQQNKLHRGIVCSAKSSLRYGAELLTWQATKQNNLRPNTIPCTAQ